ncbi:MAG: ParB/RepB/Spo0J family partition protein [Syntrophales bacterium]|jgi:ParB family chromosome partitioning protein|nr:ParB/RepB/Spo0J family partition protein [Syntrophales bacterium]
MSRTNSLGKGLGAMFPDLINNAGDRPAFVMCGIEELTPNRFQPRSDFNDDAQKELIASIKTNGVIQPIIVRKTQNGYEIIAGERRWRAAQASGMKEVPVVIRKASDRELAELSLVENIQREALNPIEEAKAYQVLSSDFSLSQDDISARVGKDRSTIANTIRLLKLPDEIQKDVISKKITAGHARALLSLDLPELQLNALRTIKKRELNVRETEGLIKRLKSSQGKNEKKSSDQYIDDMQKTLSSHLLTRVKIKSGKKAGCIEIKYANPSELDRLTRYLLER